MKHIVGGRYQLAERLGKGGMGEVHRALDLTTNRVVALKQLDRDTTERRLGRAELRFRREFHTLASLAHPRIVRVFDYGIDAGRPYYTMELLEGGDLRDLVHDELLSAEQTCRILRDVASALTLLHARGLVHRDLTARNVRIDAHGRATLFDFGVLVDAGASGEIAGTPPFVAPELLRGEAVDSRVDLYALGVLGYRMVTGRLPYPARDLNELYELLQEPLQRPSEIGEIPPALDALIMDLLSSDPLARPASAGELIDRLSSIGGLAVDPELEARGGYAPTAALVGRDAELALLEAEVHRVADTREPTGFLLVAESGSGKSRLMGEMAIRSKLAGAQCVSVSCEHRGGRPYAAIAGLFDAAFRVAPEIAFDACEPYAPLLCRVFDDVRERFPHIDIEARAGEPAEDRMRIQRAVMGAFERIAAAAPLVILVDDIQRCDEASAAVFASLLETRPAGLMLGLALREGESVRATSAVAVLQRVQPRIQLGGFDQEGVAALLRSLFGDAPNLQRIARWMHEATGGLPMLCTELARQLVDDGHIRQREGTWVFPTEPPSTLPASLDAAAKQRIARLSVNGRVSGEVLAVHGGLMELERCVELIEDLAVDASDGEARAFVTLAELQTEGVLVDAGDRFAFRHDSLREALLAGIEPERRAMLHRHVGETLLEPGAPSDPARQAEIGWHLTRGGDVARGGAFLEAAGRALYDAEALADCIPPLEAALQALEARGAPKYRKAELAFFLLSSGWISDREVGWKHALPAVDMMAAISGMRVARALWWLGPVGFLIGLSWSSLRWAARLFRGPTPLRAITYFAVGLNYACALAYAANLREGLRVLMDRAEPFRLLVGTPHAPYLVVHAMEAILDGRLGDASDGLSQAIEAIRSPWLNPSTLAERRVIESGLLSMRVLVDVNQFHNQRMEEDLARMEALGLDYFGLAADSARVVRHRYRGEEKLAKKLEDAIEPRALQLGAWTTELQIVLFAHPAYAMCHDVEGLKRSLDALERYQREGMSFDARIAATKGELMRERGEFEGAVETLGQAYTALGDDDALMSQYLSAALADTFVEAHRYPEAREWAERGIAHGATASRHVVLPQIRLQRCLALALDGLGERERAERMLDRLVAFADAMDCPSMAGQVHAARARVALTHEDTPTFEHHLAAAEEWLRPTENPGLIAVVARLAESARQPRSRSVRPSRRASDAGSEVDTVVATSQPRTSGSLDDLRTIARKGAEGSE